MVGWYLWRDVYGESGYVVWMYSYVAVVSLNQC